MIKTTLILLFVLAIPLQAQIHRNPFEATPDPDAAITYTNPVIPGFYPDPSVCRVGDDYYLVNSTFEYFPGVPVFHSKDLVHWEQIGHCIDRPGQMPEGINIFAATIRHHEGTFFMITTNVAYRGNFYVTAKDPAGPWSDPVYIDVPGIDPDLFWDDDGKAYVISSHFKLFEINLENGKLLTEGKQVWFGTGGRYAEAPHIYKKDGYYYLMAAEGGTEEAHSVTIARSNKILGPYIDNPANPILYHANAAGQRKKIQGVGHADLIQAHDDSWWMVFHGYRKAVDYPVHHILGRETCLAPVTWPLNGWPVVNGNGTASVNMTAETLPLQPFPEKGMTDDFETSSLGLEWNFIQVPANRSDFISVGNGTLKLKGKANCIGENGCPAFVGKRLRHHNFTATTRLDFAPKTAGEEAGLALVNNGQHFDLAVKRTDNQRVLVVKLQFGNITYTSDAVRLEDGPVQLRISGNESNFTFSYAQGNEFIDIETVNTRYLSTETVGWFTGVYVGLYATGNGKSGKAWAEYDYFNYEGHDTNSSGENSD